VPRLPDEIIHHYESIDEGRRITDGFAQLELVRTQEVLRRYLGDGPLRILDVGGAKGVHAAWLADDGQEVHVVDAVAGHVEAVRQLRPSRGRISAEVGDARELPLADAGFDAVLVLGPLYHLTERLDRVRALSEARRVVRPGGHVFVAAISRFASLFDGLAREFLFNAEFRQIVERDLRDGQHRIPRNRPHWFTTAFFHHPDELRAEVEDAGLDTVSVVGVEGLAGWLAHLGRRWDSKADREAILFVSRVVEAEPSLLGLSAHLLLVSRRP
jgi:ubiquinone/menaquinone biosynthesis C-methylase UbiE